MYEKIINNASSMFLRSDARLDYRDRVAVIIMIFAIASIAQFLGILWGELSPLPVAVMVFSALFYSGSLLLMKLGFYTVAKVVFMLSLSIVTASGTYLHSSHTWLHLFFFAYPVMIHTMFVLNRKWERRWARAFVVIAVLAVFTLEFFADEMIVPLSAGKVILLKIGSMSLLFLGMITAEVVLAIQMNQAEKKLKFLASTDALTGATNRRQFYEIIEAELQRIERYGGKLAAVILDLDDFKSINDNYGHALGDEVLVRFSNACRALIRGTDHFARIGGDEFALLLVESDEKQAVMTADRIRQTVERIQIETKNGNVSITTSVGVACLTPAAETADEFINRADLAMYKAKKAGGNKLLLHGR
jgi:diguanylate cyclase (GGDEF)-like protein